MPPRFAHRAVRDGDGYVLNGRKQWCTNGSFAGVTMAMFRTGGAGARRHLGAFSIEHAHAGHRRRKGHREARHPHQQHVSTSPSTTCACRRTRCSAREGDGFRRAMSALTAGRIGIAAQATGILAACLDASVKFAKERVAFGRPIGAFEGVSFKIAQMATDLDAARLLVYRAAALCRRGRPVRDRSEQGEALRLDRGAQARGRSGANSRRLRLHDRVSGRAVLPRRQDHRDLRRHLGDPADHHRPIATRQIRLERRQTTP